MKERDPEVLASHRAGHQDDLRRAIDRLVSEVLLPTARAQLGGKKNQVNLQPDSVVQSVLLDELPKAMEQCETEDHLRARLAQAVRHRVIDRTRKGGRAGSPEHESQRPEGAPAFDGAARGRSPLSELASRESDLRHADSYEQFACWLLEQAGGDQADEALLRLYVLGGAPWAGVAEAAGLSEAAARKRLSRMRSRLMPAIIEPLRDELDSRTWLIAEGLFIRHEGPVLLARSSGLEESAIERSLGQEIAPALKRLYGVPSLEPIWRLVGRLKK